MSKQKKVIKHSPPYSRVKTSTPTVSDVPSVCTYALTLLDGLKDALFYRGGRSGDTPYYMVNSYSTDLFNQQNIKDILPVRYVARGLVSNNSWENSFFYPHKKKKGLQRKSGVKIHPDFCYYCLDLQSGLSAVYFLLGYLEVLFDSYPDLLFGMDLPTILEPLSFLGELEPLNFVPVAKFLTAYPMARYMKQASMPPYPKALPIGREFLYVGKVKKFLKNRIVSFTRKNTSFFLGLLQGVKRAALAVPDDYLIRSLGKHALTLSKRSDNDDIALRRNFYSTGWDVLQEKISFQEIFLRRLHTLTSSFSISTSEILDQPYEPSPNASFLFQRHHGGQRAEIMYTLQILEDRDISPPEKSRGPNPWFDLVKLSADHKHRVEMLGRSVPSSINRTLLQCFIDSIPERQSWEDGRLAIKANVVPLPEPLKVRTITAGEGVPYYLVKPLQLKMWSYLQLLPQFSLTGEPLDGSHIFLLLDREFTLFNKVNLEPVFDEWVSGDYAAATDGLDIKFTLDVLSSFIARARESAVPTNDIESRHLDTYFDIANAVLNKHILCYRFSDVDEYSTFVESLGDSADSVIHHVEINCKGQYTVEVIQHTGQLMGSPLSFPALCIINLITYWIALEDYLSISSGRPIRVKLRDLPVLVNGDDILFRANQDFYTNYWSHYISIVGFKLSLGKNYIHPTLLTVNSIMYEFKWLNVCNMPENVFATLDERKVPPYALHKIDYLNPGLLTGQSKSTMRDAARKLPLGDLYKIVVSGANDRPRAHRRFLHYNRQQISDITESGKFNLFVPIHLGGLGWEVFPEVYNRDLIHFTNFQRRFATFLVAKSDECMELGLDPKKYTHALVSDIPNLSTAKIDRFGVPVPLVRHEFGPLEEHFVPETPLELRFPTLSHPHVHGLPSGFQSELTYRHPSRDLLREFSSSDFSSEDESTIRRRMSDDIFLNHRFQRIVRSVSV